MSSPGEQYDYQCIICLEIADRAVVTQCCAKVMCSLCYLKVMEKDCPNCRAEKWQAKEETFLRKMIMEIAPEIQIVVKNLQGKTIVINLK